MTDRERRASLIFSQYECDSVVVPYANHEESRGIYNPEHVEALYPVDPSTSYPRTDLGTLTDPSLTEYEKETIMQRLQKMEGTYLPSDLSDEEILSLVPSRFFYNDPVDVQMWRDYLSDHVVPGMKDPDKIVDLVDENNPNEPNEPNNE